MKSDKPFVSSKSTTEYKYENTSALLMIFFCQTGKIVHFYDAISQQISTNGAFQPRTVT